MTTFKVIGGDGSDAAAWRDALAALPYDLHSIHLSRGWGQLHSDLASAPILAIMRDDDRGFLTVQAMMMRAIPTGAGYDTAAISYGGPVTSSVMPSLDEAVEFQNRLCDWAGGAGVVTDFYLVNPDLAAHQAIFHRGRDLVKRRSVSILPLTANGIDTRGASHGRLVEIIAADGFEISEIAPRTFSAVYGPAMEARKASARWCFDDAHFDRMKHCLGHDCLILGAYFKQQLAGVAIFLTGGPSAHYHLAARPEPGVVPGAATALICAGGRAARQRGAAWLNLGGGLQDGDSLDRFKASFGGLRKPVYSAQTIYDSEAFGRLMAPKLGFAIDGPFPAYRFLEEA